MTSELKMFYIEETFAKRPLSKSALIWQISALDSIFGTLVKLQRYPQNTQCIPPVKNFVRLELCQN